jgi:hypothetical protein
VRGRGARREYGWAQAEVELAQGVHPEVAAARIGEPIDFLLETADAQGWPITWNGSQRATSMSDFDA